MTTVFIFRRDFRIVDNVEWSRLASSKGDNTSVLPVFIFNPSQIEAKHNKQYSPTSVAFLCGSLLELQKEFLPPLRFLYAPATLATKGPGAADVHVLEALHKVVPFTSIAFNADYTPYARARDAHILQWATRKGITVQMSTSEYSVVDPASMDKPYQVFTPFYRRYSALGIYTNPVSATRSPIYFEKYASSLPFEVSSARVAAIMAEGKADLDINPGRQAGLAILARIRRAHFKNYASERDHLSKTDATTRLSAYIKFGCVSVREVRQAILFTKPAAKAEPLLRQLYWRAFYDQITWHFPHVLNGQTSQRATATLNHAMKVKYDDMNSKWSKNADHLKAWQTGHTGFPIVDAAMRQLEQTGFMHNRARMIVASFLVKDLHLPWQEGEAWFAAHLTDYDPSSNNGGWQWAASTGADAQPYFRIFNPWTQSAKFDPDAVYIKRFVPELADVPAKDIHIWDKTHAKYSNKVDYPAPMVDHAKQSQLAKNMYAKILNP